MWEPFFAIALFICSGGIGLLNPFRHKNLIDITDSHATESIDMISPGFL